jgi:hypothetical protein
MTDRLSLSLVATLPAGTLVLCTLAGKSFATKDRSVMVATLARNGAVRVLPTSL